VVTDEISYRRQLGFFDPAEHDTAAATVVGLGGIGSFAAMALSKLGMPTLQLVDFDTLEPHNIPNQLYPASSVEQSKADAMRETCAAFGGGEVLAYNGRLNEAGFAPVDPDSPVFQPTEVMVSGLDSMAARTSVWTYMRMNPRVKLYIDARIAGQLIVIYALNPMKIEDIDAYEATLHTDDEAMPAACTERGVIDVGMVVGGMITTLTRSYYAKREIDPITIINLEHLTLSKGEWVL